VPANDASEGKPLPAFSVVRGQPTAAELAAVVVVLGALAGRARGGQPARPPARPEWSSRARLMRPAPVAGPGAWRASALPQ
jgi:hypothetical protein